MSRWGKNIVVPLDSLCKEKENTNRPTVARSVGTVGKWGKMGFTSTRTYTLSGLPAAVAAAAAAAAAAASPGQSPASALDDDMSPSAPEPPKPKKFFKSRNAAPPEVIAQIIQHLPRAPTSPIRDAGAAATPGYLMTPVHGREPIKLKIAKNNTIERKKKSPKKASKSLKAAAAATGAIDNADDDMIPKQPVELKSKKKKEEKKLKPEAPPSRIISRARKAVNYCEDDDDDRMPTPIKDLIIAKDKPSITVEEGTQAVKTPATIASENIPAASPVNFKPELPPPAALPLSTSLSSVPVISNAGATPSISTVNMTSKTPEHPPIVLRISKGTSRLVSTDSEELPNNGAASPAQAYDTELAKSRHASTEEVPPAALVNTLTTPKIIVKPPKPPSPEPAPTSLLNNDEPPEINYSTVKISPDKPPKERLKLIIKTDVIRNALAAAAAAAAAKAAAAAQRQAAAEAAALSGADSVERPEKEKKQKSKKHKHLKHAAIELLVPAHMPTAVAGSEFKTPSPHLALGLSVTGEREQQQQQQNVQHASTARTIISPPALSERDFDSQSSVLGSISSKGNSTPQPLAQTVQEESCVIHSRGSSVITSDLETSQHSSLVAPPSDIESRLESMMMDGEASQKPANLVVEEPLQEDILAVLIGDESVMGNSAIIDNGDVNMNDVAVEKIRDKPADKENQETTSKRRVTRGRTRGASSKTNYAEEEDMASPNKAIPIATVAAATTARTTRGRGKTAVASVAALPAAAEEASLPKRATRRGVKKTDETATTTMEMDDSPTKLLVVTTMAEKTTPSKIVEVNPAKLQLVAELPVTRRGRTTRNANNNQNHHANNNSNINKIAANLSAKAGAAEEAKSTSSISPTITSTTTTTPPTQTPRSYGRKRKNQQVTQVLQPSAEELEEQQQHPTPSKMLHIDLPTYNEATSATTPSPSNNYDQRQQHTPNLDLHDTNSNNSNSLTRPPSTTNSSPPRRDYKVKDKFKRTLTLDSQVNCNAVIASPTASTSDEMGLVAACIAEPHEGNEEKQRGSVKLVISKKKGSIFKSRALGSADPSEQTAATKRHLYKHRWDAEASGEQVNDAAAHKPVDTPEPATLSARNPAAAVAAIFDDFDDDAETNTNSRDAVPAFKANPFRVGNVKSAHEMQEMGETLELDDNVRYVMDALQPSNATPTRCLSAVRLAKECMKHDFRMHVRAHGVVNKFYRVLTDAHQYASLGLCTAAIMYILSQEGLSNDLDRDSFALMMNLLKADGNAAPSDRACYESNRQKIRILCEEMSTPGRPSYLNMDSLTASSLAMETLFALTSKCASEWFKEALRELGGLEHFMKLISDCCRPVLEGGVSVGGGGISKPTTPIAWTQLLLDNIKTVERCMRAMENVTHLNVKNQKYLLKYADGTCVNTMCTLYCLCDRELVLHPTTDDTTDKQHPGVVIRELLLAVLKVLNTLTYTLNPANPLGAEIVGERVDVIETSFYLLLQAPNYIPDRCVFDMSILVLNLLNNLAMHSKSSRALIMKTYAPPGYSSHQQNKVTAVQAVIEYFYKCEEMARLVDEDTDANLEKTAKTKKRQEAVDENALILLQGADRHMEHTLKGSYAGLLIGHLIKDSEENEAIMRTHLPVVGFKDIVSILEKYYKFMVLTGNTEASFVGHMKSTQDVIDYFRKRDLIYEMNDNALPLNLETHHAGAANTSGSTTAPTATEDDAPSTSRAAVTRSSAPRVYKTYSQR